MSPPKLSFIVRSYNYQAYIGQTIRSILDQTVQDFEIVVVDDASIDGSCGIVSSFGDPRIRLLVNEQNRGSAASNNRAVTAATGDYLVNVDADDWIVPQKCEWQLAFLSHHKVQVAGTYVTFVDSKGEPHPRTTELNGLINRPHQLNAIDGWLGQNNLARSSTMVDRAALMRVGLDDPAMRRACDYELWTRCLRAGCRFGVLPEQLTYYRLHSQGVTHADPLGTLLEMSYAMLRNLMPLIEQQAAYSLIPRMVNWITEQDSFGKLHPIEQHRLLAMLATSPDITSFDQFRRRLSDDESDVALDMTGRRLHAIATDRTVIHQLMTSIAAYIAGRDYWLDQARAWQQAAHGAHSESQQLRSDIAALTEARDFWHSQSLQGQNMQDDIAALIEARDFWHRQSLAWEQQVREPRTTERGLRGWVGRMLRPGAR
jgi:glycosyltransferase involved in cell wall biosynthesis